jgi:hypothetical protein
MFSNVNPSFFIGHGTYGTDVDYHSDASQSEETYLLSDSPVDASAPWVRLSECGFGGNLRWMGLLACDMLRDENFFSMYDVGVLPIPSNLHLLCSSSTISFTTSNIGRLWASKMCNQEPVSTAWFNAAQEAYLGSTVIDPVIFRVVGYDNCFSDTLQNYAAGTSGTLDWRDRQVAP